jgi:transcriptional regulator with XRE-family HTH domain
MSNLDAASLVREARRRAGLSQRALARRSGTAQSVVARIEGGLTDPSTRTLARLVAAAGFDLEPTLTPSVVSAEMLDDVPRILALTPEARLVEVRNVSQFETAARRV